ncbi:MAG: hypothetical protein SFZ03_11680 [Candidatus Melainabacteria bacterium]|nr:hypothetical protein [Candidatus Melainabacteria bacterium]
MCEPISATAAAVLSGLAIVASTASGIVGYIGQSQAASQQAAYQSALAQQRNQQIAENQRLAQEAYLQQAHQVNLRQQQEEEKASQETQSAQIEAMQARARARVASGEAGVSGLSVDNLIADFYRQEDVYKQGIQRNVELSRQQSQEDIKGLRAQAEGRYQAIQPYLPEPIARPSFLGAALQIGTNAALQTSSAISQYRLNKITKTS